MNPPPPFDPTLDKAQVVRHLADALGRPEINEWTPDHVLSITEQALRTFGPQQNTDIQISRDAGPSAVVEVFGEEVHDTEPVRYLNAKPKIVDDFVYPWRLRSPAGRLARFRNGRFLALQHSPVIFNEDGVVSKQYSSPYADLIHFYETSAAFRPEQERKISGQALVLLDWVWADNYCHWLINWLPRLLMAREVVDISRLTLITTPLRANFQRHLLSRLGFDKDRICEVAAWDSVVADELLVADDAQNIPHPGYRAASWVRHGLRSLFRPGVPASRRRKVYVSRRDSSGRRIMNEDALFSELERYGFEQVVLSEFSVAEQADIFGGAEVIVGVHGAGLTNIVFADPGSRFVEIFPSVYGTAAFQKLALSQGISHCGYTVTDLFGEVRGNVKDLMIDTDHFLSLAGDFIR